MYTCCMDVYKNPCGTVNYSRKKKYKEPREGKVYSSPPHSLTCKYFMENQNVYKQQASSNKKSSKMLSLCLYIYLSF